MEDLKKELSVENKFYIQKYVNDIDDLRKQNKDQWYTYQGYAKDHKYFTLKAFNTWISKFIIFDAEGNIEYKDGSLMDISVKEFRKYLTDMISLAYE